MISFEALEKLWRSLEKLWRGFGEAFGALQKLLKPWEAFEALEKIETCVEDCFKNCFDGCFED